MNNPFTEQYRQYIRGLHAQEAEKAHHVFVVDLYYALDEALGRIYELEETLSGREEQHVRDKELL